MKIVCTAKEFAQVLRSCEYYRGSRGCEGCALLGICGPDSEADKPEECIEFEIVD